MRFLAEPLAWLSSEWLDDDGVFNNGGLTCPSVSSAAEPVTCLKLKGCSMNQLMHLFRHCWGC